MEELTIPSKEDIYGDNRLFKDTKYDKFYNFANRKNVTPLAIIKGAQMIMVDNEPDFQTMLTQTYTIDDFGINSYANLMHRCGKTYEIDSSANYGIIYPILKNPEGINFNVVADEIEYGEYAQDIPNYKMQCKLNLLKLKDRLRKTEESYTFNQDSTNFKPETCNVYKYMGRKYIQTKMLHRDGLSYKARNCILKDEMSVHKNSYYVWVEVKKIKWIVDRVNYQLVSKKGLLSGIPVGESKYFEESFMYEFLNTHMLRDMFQSRNKLEIKEEESPIFSNYQKEIDKLIKELYKITNKEDIEEVKKKVQLILNNYNNKIQLLNYNDILVLDTFDSLYCDVVSKINNLIYEYKVYLNVNRINIEIISVLDSIISILSNYNYNGDNELCLFMNEVNKILDDNNRYKLFSIINKYKEEINEIKLDNKLSLNYPKYSSYKNFEMDFRNKLEIILNNIKKESLELEKISIEESIFIKYRKLLENNYRNMILEQIENNKDTLKYANEEELEKVRSIIEEYKKIDDLTSSKALEISIKLDNIYSKIIEKIILIIKRKYIFTQKIINIYVIKFLFLNSNETSYREK